MTSVRPSAQWNHLLPLILPLFLLILGASVAEAQTSEDVNKYLQYTDNLKTMWTESLKTLYQLSQSFMTSVTGNGIFRTVFQQFGVNITDISTYFSANWTIGDGNKFAKNVVNECTGYIVIISVGIILIVFFACSSCCLICCRKIGGCCGKLAANDVKPSDVPLTVVLFVLVVVLSTLMFLSAYGSIVSGVTAVDSLKEDKESGFPLVGNILPAVRGLLVFLNRTIEEFNGIINVTESSERFGNFMSRVPAFIQKELKMVENECPSCGVLLNDSELLKSYGKNVTFLLERFQTHQTTLNSEYLSFNETLKDFENRTLFALDNCSSNTCDMLKDLVSNLTLLRFLHDQDITNFTGKIQEVNKLDSIVFGIFPSISAQMDGIIKTIFENINNLVDIFLGLVRNLDVLQYDKKYLNVNSTVYSGFNWGNVNKVSSTVLFAIKIVVIIFASVFFVVVLINVIGLILGPTCVRKSPKASEKAFVASSQISLIGGAPFCILAMFLFVFGTLAYREVCQDVRKEENCQYFMVVDQFLRQKVQEVEIFKSFNFSGNFSLKPNFDYFYPITNIVMRDCKNNESFSKVLFEILNINNETMDGLLMSFSPYLDKLRNKSLSELPTFSNDVIDSLRNASRDIDELSNSTFYYLNESIPLFIPSLEMIASQMNATLHDGSNVNRTLMENLLGMDVPIINETSLNITTEEKAMISQMVEISEALAIVSQLLTSMANASSNARKELTNVSTDNFVTNLQNELNSTINEAFNYSKEKLMGVGTCRELYTIFNLFFYFFCDLVINPLNAYWFSLGISIVLLIPSFLAGLWLGGLFARRHKTFEDYEGSEDDDAEFLGGGKYMTDQHITGNIEVPSGSKISIMPTGLAAGPPEAGDAGDFPMRSKAPGKVGAFPRRFVADDLENASLYYIPPFSNSNPQPPISNNYAATDPYYNMSYFRMPQDNRPISRFDTRMPRPWIPQSSGISPYQRF